MSLVINKYKILNPSLAYDPDYTGPTIDVPKSFAEGTTFEVVGIDMSGFVLRETESNLKIQMNSEIFNQGFYKVNG
ncbi:MAG: hypothetical protein ACI9HU_000239 [Colwellia sp.]|jgi:hypothetical protein